MKAGWQEKTVGEILTLEYGKPLADIDRKANGRYPVYGANGEKDRTDKFFHGRPSIIVGRKGSAGEINLTEEKFWPLDVTYFVKFNESHYDLRFLYYLLKMLDLPKLAKGVKPGINRNEVYSIFTKVPPLPEQQRIAALLDGALDAIAAAKAIAEKNRQNAREVFENYLQTVFTQRGEGWKKTQLGEICSLITDGKHGDCQDENDSGYYFLSAKDLKNSTLNFENARQITKADFEETHRRTNLKPNDICMVNTGATIGKLALAPDDPRTTCTTFQKSVAVIKPISSIIDNLFCFYHLKRDLLKLVNVASGSAQKNLLLGDLRMHLISYPPLNKQKIIARNIKEISLETQRLESIYQRKLAALDELKQSLLHQAFSGEL